MNIYFCCMLIAGDADPVVIVDCTPAVFLRVGDDIDEIVGNVGSKVS